MNLPKMKINNFKSILAKPEIDRFTGSTYDNAGLWLTVHEDETGTYFVIHSGIQVYGWTTNYVDAFNVWGNISVLTATELYNTLRGK